MGVGAAARYGLSKVCVIQVTNWSGLLVGFTIRLGVWGHEMRR